MFCQDCGTKIEDDASQCPKCGWKTDRATPDVAAQVRAQIMESSQDAAKSVRVLITNPVGGLRSAYATLGPSRSVGAGIALSVIGAVLFALAVSIAADRLGYGPFGALALSTFRLSRASIFFRSFAAFLILPVALTAACYGLQRLLAKEKQLAPLVLSSGASLLPLALSALLAAILGGGNFEVAIVLVLFALCYLVLILFTGLKELGSLTERAAAPATPVALLVSGWLTKIVLVAIF